MSNSPDRAGYAPETEEEENTPESVLQRLRDERSRGGPFKLLGWRVPWQVIAGAVVVIVLAMAFFLRPGDAGEQPKTASPSPAAATAAPAAAPAAAAATPAPQPTPVPAPTQERIHTVESGDTLSILAEKYYNDSSKHSVIFEANKDILKDPDSLQIGQRLKIPN
jgi:nucleoid-associated protein YgaU